MNDIKSQTIRKGHKDYKCDFCEKSFTRSNYLTIHIRTVHENPGPEFVWGSTGWVRVGNEPEVNPDQKLQSCNEAELLNPDQKLKSSNKPVLVNPDQKLQSSNEPVLVNPVQKLKSSNEPELVNSVQRLQSSNEQDLVNSVQKLPSLSKTMTDV